MPQLQSGGLGAPNPERVYERLVQDVVKVLGDFPVQVRQYAEGAEARKEIKRLQETIALYMKDLEPGSRYTKTRFTKEQAEATLDKLISELEAIAPETAKDRWVNVHGGKTFREHWQGVGMGTMSADRDSLRRRTARCSATQGCDAQQR